MTKTFNKHFFKRLLSSTALIGALLFSNTLSVSAEEIEDTQSVQDQTVEVKSTEDDQDTYEKENADDSVDEVDDLSDIEGSAPNDEATGSDYSEKTGEELKELEELETDEPSELEDKDQTDNQSEADETSEAADKTVDEDASVPDEESESKDDELTQAEKTEDIEPEEAVESEETTTDEEEANGSEETAKDDEENSDEASDEDSDEDTEESTEESAQTFEETLSAPDQQFFAPMMASLPSARVASINEGPVERIEGATRDHIAATISQRGWDSSDVVYLVNGFKEADALTGAPLARANDAPILFTRVNVLPSVTLNEINRLGASKVVILGGNKSVPQDIVSTLENNNLTVERIDGNTRYDLASGIAKEVMEAEGTQRDAFLVNGEAYADAISIAPVAANKRLPIFLTKSFELHDEVRKAIPYVNSWHIIGGLVSIPNGIVSEMEDAGAAIANRLDGNNRYAVNRNIINYYGNPKDYTYVASGEVVSDALATSTLAGKEGANILLVKNNNVKTLHDQTEFIKDEQNVEEFVLVGGEKTLSKRTENHFEEPLVYVDPGHGGWETGTAHYGIVEKNLNLSISHKLKDRLEDYGYEVVMSRTDDSQVDLYDRPAEANALGADIFVSVHNNAMPGSSAVHGIENYYYQYDESDTYKPQYPVGSDAWNKATSQHRDNESKRLADAIHNELIADTGAVDRGTKEMGFAVIRETFMPAVLLELGFVSNYNEAQRLNTASYQWTLANAVVSGINDYFML